VAAWRRMSFPADHRRLGGDHRTAQTPALNLTSWASVRYALEKAWFEINSRGNALPNAGMDEFADTIKRLFGAPTETEAAVHIGPRMPHPTRNNGTGIFYLRVRVPSDVVAKVKGQMITLPVGNDMIPTKAREAVRLSLRTRDPREAERRFAAAQAALNSAWEAARNGLS
jgi:hypothetical protein